MTTTTTTMTATTSRVGQTLAARFDGGDELVHCVADGDDVLRWETSDGGRSGRWAVRLWDLNRARQGAAGDRGGAADGGV